MLSQIGEWYQTTDLKNNDERLAQRRRAAETLIAAWEKAPPALQIVDVVCLGLEAALEARTGENPALEQVFDAISQEQPTFDRTQGATTIDARLCVLMALGELMHRRLGKADTLRKKEPALAAAQAIACALRYRMPTIGAFLDDKLQTLLETSERLLAKLDQARRARRANPTAALANVAFTSESGLVDLKKVVGEALEQLATNAALDREELQALWWVFGGYSLSQAKLFKTLDPATAALMAGVELSEIVAWPGTLGVGVLAARVAALSEAAETHAYSEFVKPVTDAVWSRCISPAQASQLKGRAMSLPLLSAAASPDHELPSSALIATSTLGCEEMAIQIFSEKCLLNTLAG